MGYEVVADVKSEEAILKSEHRLFKLPKSFAVIHCSIVVPVLNSYWFKSQRLGCYCGLCNSALHVGESGGCGKKSAYLSWLSKVFFEDFVYIIYILVLGRSLHEVSYGENIGAVCINFAFCVFGVSQV